MILKPSLGQNHFINIIMYNYNNYIIKKSPRAGDDDSTG